MTQIIKVSDQPTKIIQGAPVQVNVVTDVSVGNKGDVTVITPTSWAVNPQSLADKFVFGETPIGLINGSNATFTTANQFIPESLTVKVNGLTQKLVDDYTVSGGLTITLLASPVVGDSILVNYIKA